MVIASEGIFRDNERWLSRARAFPSCFSGWNHSANAAPGITIRLNMLAAPLFKHSIRLDISANAAYKYSTCLNVPTTPLFKHSIRLNILTNAAPKHSLRLNVLAPPAQPSHPFRCAAMGEKLPQRGYTFDSPGLPTIGGYPG